MLWRSAEARRELVLVEGVFDLHQLRAHGLERVAALERTEARPELFERLASLGVETVTLCLDNDEAGRAATARTVEHAVRAPKSPALFVVDPKRLGSAKDPDAYVLTRGIAAWQALVEERECAIGWHAAEHLRDVTDTSPQDARREALLASRNMAREASAPARARAGGRRPGRGRPLRLQHRRGATFVSGTLLAGPRSRSITLL